MSVFRRCCRPGCDKPAVTTLTYVYAESTAVVGPLAAASESHSWNLCEKHVCPVTAPLGWELVRYDVPTSTQDDDDLTALAEAVREAGRNTTGLVLRGEVDSRPQTYKIDSNRRSSTWRSARGHLHVIRDPEDPDG